MIRIENLSHSYAPDIKITFPNWEINTGEKWLLGGQSGSGKSTLLHILTGILKPSAGIVSLDNVSLYDLSARKLDQFRAQKIGIIFQKAHFIKSLTLKENLMVAQSFAGFKVDGNRIKSVLGSLGIDSKLNAFPDQLSQGQLQRASIARAVINKPSLLIADEPTSSLDDNNTFIVLDLLKSQSELNGSTLVVATHDQRVKEAFHLSYQLV
ncbi:MAG: ATP-binding cassette domain-containing protein [Pedobacter sp.]|nr:MAG: ATP-binding cassette domain-containing protein [Pedobacter sp.]